MDKTTLDLISIVESDLGPGRRCGRWTLWRCPFHSDHTPSLAVTNGDGSRGPFWQCFAASCGKHGGPLEWLIAYRSLGTEAAQQLLAGAGYDPAQAAPRTDPAISPPDNPPGPAWQKRAWELVQHAEAALWDQHGQAPILWEERDPVSGKRGYRQCPPIEWLKERGLTEDTLRLWRIGYVPQSWYDAPEKWGLRGKGIWISRGILIPCMVANQIWYLKIRRAEGPPKYIHIRQSQPALYMVQTIEFHERVVFCEGELDALLLWQEAGDLASVVTLGSAGAPFSVITWGFYLLNTRTRFLAYDADKAGETGGEKLAWMTTRRLEIPRLRPHDKDLTDYHRSGGNLRSWLQDALQNEALPS